MALGAGGLAQFALSVQGLWRVKRSVVGFVLFLAIPFLALAALLGAFFLTNN